MYKWISMVAVVAVVAVISVGCTKDETMPKGKGANTKLTKVTLPEKGVCAKCGFAKSDTCCAEAAKGHECDKCTFVHGSPLCCVEGLKSKDGVYCAKCGELESNEEHCDGDTCEKCGLQQGSPLCCNVMTDTFLNAKVETEHEDDEDGDKKEVKEEKKEEKTEAKNEATEEKKDSKDETKDDESE